MKKLMMVIATVGATLAVQSATEIVDGVRWSYITDYQRTGALITSQKTVTPAIDVSTAGTISVPLELGGCPVRIVDSFAFYGCSNLTAVIIPNGVKSIGSEVFFNCSKLESVTLPNGITRIENYTFSRCGSLVSVKIPEGVTSIGEYAFWECRGLKAVEIPSSVTSIGTWAFSGCSSLTSVTIPDKVTSISPSLFSGCSGLKSVFIPNGVTNIHGSAFANCSVLKTAMIPEGVLEIGAWAFSGCSELRTVTIPSSVLRIGSAGFEAFRDCNNLKGAWFAGPPPEGVEHSGIDKSKVVYPRRYAAEWHALGFLCPKNGNYFLRNNPLVEILSSTIRENDPMVMDVDYRVRSVESSVKVRALAFKDGVRSFNNVVRPETFIEGTAVNVGDSVEANEIHRLSWRVSEDYGVELARMKFEVIAQEGDLLPMEWITIPKSEKYDKMKVSYNQITEELAFDALMWLYAANDPDLSLSGGTLMAGGYKVAQGPSISTAWMDVPPGGYVGYYYVIDYLYSKLGCSVLSGDVLNYAREETRKDLPYERKGISKCAYKFVD